MKDLEKLPELMLADGSPGDSSRFSRLVAKGKLRRIYAKVYTSNLEAPLETIVKRHAYDIAAHICPDGVLSHSTAFGGGLVNESTLVITAGGRRTVELPGLSLWIRKGPAASPSDQPYLGSLKISSFSRSLLENLQSSREKNGFRKTVGRKRVEEKLEQICSLQGEDELNSIRSEARAESKLLGMEKEFKKLDSLIGALLGTRASKVLSTRSGLARSIGKPYDVDCIELMDALCEELVGREFPSLADPIASSDLKARTVRAFYEAYFSNYIEGTRFELKEAESIVFSGATFDRHKDSHDIIGTYQLAHQSVAVDFSNSSDLEAGLKAMHLHLMEARPETRPGLFKEKRNQAGFTVFVDPQLVRGTLIQAGKRIERLSNPLARGIFAMFAISEIHPFDDGNGRLARLVMNGELSRLGQCRIIVPTSRRVDYVQSLKAMSMGKPAPLVGFMLKMGLETSRIDFSDTDRAADQYEELNAFEEYSEGFNMVSPQTGIERRIT